MLLINLTYYAQYYTQVKDWYLGIVTVNWHKRVFRINKVTVLLEYIALLAKEK